MVSASKSEKNFLPDVREQAVKTLVRWESNRGNFDRISRVFLAALPSSRRPFYTELSKGVLRHLSFLDFKMESISGASLSNLPPWIRNVFRVGGYQLEYSRIPKPVTVYLMVELAKTHYRELAGMVNSVLRKWASGASVTLPKDSLKALSITHSHPDWLVKRWLDRFGLEETKNLLTWNNTLPSLDLSVNSLRLTQDNFMEICEEKKIKLTFSMVPDSFVLEPPQAIEKIPGFHEGFFWVQGISALLPVYALAPKPGQTVIDLCAAPGGKSCQMAVMMDNRGEILAVDSEPSRLSMVEENRRRLGLPSIRPILADGREIGSVYSQSADAVLLDAPCSATGVFRKRVDARWNRAPEDLVRFPILQRELLESAAEAVKPGGVAVYSTCSLEVEENEEVIESFLKAHAEFSLQDPRPYLPETIRNSFTGQKLFLKILPQAHGLDGFFIARLRKARP